MWARCLWRLGDAHASTIPALHALGAARSVWAYELQRPVELLQRDITAKPFWESNELPAAQALEAAYETILAELRSLRQAGKDSDAAAEAELSPVPPMEDSATSKVGFSQYRSPVVSSGAWKDFQFFASCRKDVAHCAACPATAAAIAACPGINSMIFGSSFFSALAPGTHLDAHCGPSNLRLRVHLGLEVPDGCRIRVGTETRAWEAGKCLIFDDSFEHEVWHEGDEERIVLICDLWHPDVNLEEMIHPLLDAEQVEDLEAAQRGEHQGLAERGYSTGERVKREP